MASTSADLSSKATLSPPAKIALPGAAELRFPFAFAICHVGAEAAAKAELLRLRPHYRPAFMRPGLLTWKCEPPLALDEALNAVFVRAYGASLGWAHSASDVAALLADLSLPEVAGPTPLRLHVFARDSARRSEAKDAAADGETEQQVRAVEQALIAARPGRLQAGAAEKLGELVLDVVIAPVAHQPSAELANPATENPATDRAAATAKTAEPWLLGLHRHSADHSPHAGGRGPLRLPPEAPSRAWLKLQEGLQWSGLLLRPGHVAVEIGAAPGGASWALLDRGLTVVGVDPGAMDPRVLARPRFSHIQTTLAALRREQLPARVDWLLLDVNLAPPVALHGLLRLVGTLRGTLRGLLLTLKLNDWSMADSVPDWLRQVAAMGFTEVRATQLGSNRQEICVAAQRRAR